MKEYTAALERVDRLLRERMDAHATVGLVCALTDREKTIWLSTYGFANRAARTPVDPDHLFEIGSIGKSFTCLVLLKLHEMGKLDLHAPVSEFVPWFQVQSAFEPITAHHLMTHSAGLTVGADFAPSARYEAWALRNAPIRYAPGKHYHYSNAGYKLLGFIAADLAGRPYGDLLQEWILDPVGMTSSDALTTHASRARLALGYVPYYDDRPWHSDDALAPAPWFEYGAGDGSPASTAEDMAAYLRMLLNRGESPGGQVISTESFEKMITGAVSAGETDYGYGLQTFRKDGRRMIKHNGGTIGYLATMLADLDSGFGAIIMLNGPDPADKDFVAEAALQLLHAAANGETLPAAEPPEESPEPDLAEYIGEYLAGGQTVQVSLEDGVSIIQSNSISAPLESRAADQFYTRHPSFDRYLLDFQRRDGAIVALANGPATYWKVGREASHPAPDVPESWQAYPGHYRAYNPWFSNFRAYLRDGQLYLAYQIYLSSFEAPLSPDGEGAFVIGAEPTPERIEFDTIINGKAQRARVFGGEYYRFFTP